MTCFKMDASTRLRVAHLLARGRLLSAGLTGRKYRSAEERVCLCGGAQRPQTSSVATPKRWMYTGQAAQGPTLAEQFKLAADSMHKQKTNIRTTFRTQEDDPTKHNIDQEGLFYTVEDAVVKRVLQKGLPKFFLRECKTFLETSIMVRKPALEVLDYIQHAHLDLPVLRIVLYGKRGCGKTLSLAHVIHACTAQKWLLVHLPWPYMWIRHFKEVAPSSHRNHRVDLPAEAAEWLALFKTQNQGLLDGLMTTKTYVWTKRESMPEGTPLTELIDYGQARVKFASDCVGALLREIRHHATEGRCKVLVAVDGINAFWTETKIRNQDKQLVPAHQVSLIHNFKKMLVPTWRNGVVVCTVDKNANSHEQRSEDTPRYLLGKEGFETLDPFIPVLVPSYSEKEIHSCLEFYIDRNWIQTEGAKTEEGKKELIFLSDKNPAELSRLCASR